MTIEKSHFKWGNGELRQTIHIRLRPAPPAILFTSYLIHDRVVIEDHVGLRGGVWRRVSHDLLKSLEAEQGRIITTNAPDSQGQDRWDRLQAIIQMALQTIELFPSVYIPDGDFVNSPTPDLSCY